MQRRCDWLTAGALLRPTMSDFCKMLLRLARQHASIGIERVHRNVVIPLTRLSKLSIQHSLLKQAYVATCTPREVVPSFQVP